MDNTISKALLDSIKDESVNLISDASEVGVELLVGNNSLLSQIPFVSAAVSIYKIGHSIKEIHHLKQLWIFIDEVNNGLADEKDREAYICKFNETDEKTRNKELEYVILICDKYLTEDKPKYLAMLYIKYIMGLMSWEMFVSYSIVLDRFFPGDMDTLERGEQIKVKDEEVSDSVLRLVSLGIFTTVSENVSVPNTTGVLTFPASNIKDYRLTAFGCNLRECLGFFSKDILKDGN